MKKAHNLVESNRKLARSLNELKIRGEGVYLYFCKEGIAFSTVEWMITKEGDGRLEKIYYEDKDFETKLDKVLSDLKIEKPWG